QKALTEYLENVQVGEFLTGTMSDVRKKIPVHSQEDRNNYKDPTQVLPIPPPACCVNKEECTSKNDCIDWQLRYKDTVDDLIIRSNIHSCCGCQNSEGVCTARFPRMVVPITTVNQEDGSLQVKKLEPMINNVSPVVTYLMRCNTDVTSLLSGTAIKAIVAYVSDYVSKQSLKTYQIFATIRDIL
ncbi:hypothetical protein BDZ94DRAFT_1119215, partial [Collybia nuda]